MLNRRETIGWLTVAMLFTGPLALSGAAPEPQGPRAVAQIEVGPTRVEWAPKAGDYERLILTVAGPGDFYAEREFGPGEVPSFSSFDVRGDRLPDGVYAYELRALSRPDLRQSGHLWLREGSFVNRRPDQLAPSKPRGSAPKPPLPNVTPKDIVQPDDLIVQGQACIGINCVDGDADDGVLLRLKEDFGGQIRFQGANCCHPATRSWALQANIGVTGDFVIRDLLQATIPFRIAAQSPENALTIGGTSGNIGLGTLTPANRLHVFGSAGTNKALIQEASGAAASRELLELRNNGGPALILEDTSVAQRWAASTLGANFLINEQANAGTEFTLTNTGNLTISGTLTQGSSRDLKTDFVSLDPRDVLAKVKALPVSMWSYKLDDPKVRHVGPTAEDFHKAFGLGGDDKRIAPSDQAGVALVAVQGLTHEVEELRRKNAALEGRLAELEALLSALKPQE